MPHIEGAGNLIGLSKREYFAGLAMQGYCANNECHTGGYEKIAKWSVEMADALINALNQ
jgi:hypothetical protein